MLADTIRQFADYLEKPYTAFPVSSLAACYSPDPLPADTVTSNLRSKKQNNSQEQNGWLHKFLIFLSLCSSAFSVVWTKRANPLPYLFQKPVRPSKSNTGDDPYPTTVQQIFPSYLLICWISFQCYFKSGISQSISRSCNALRTLSQIESTSLALLC